jgi:DNA-binding transcriptional ArsR family regulator
MVQQLASSASSERLNATFAALSDPTRRAILARLAKGETSVTDLAQPFEMSLPAISKHLKVLERAGLIARGREAQWRPCRLEAAPLKDAAKWIEHYRRFWEESLDRLDEYLRELQSKEKKNGSKK